MHVSVVFRHLRLLEVDIVVTWIFQLNRAAPARIHICVQAGRLLGEDLIGGGVDVYV